jgi:hydroxypyruvate reductase
MPTGEALPTANPRALLADLYWAAVRAAAPGPALTAALASRRPRPARRVHLLALGKAAAPMAEAAVAALAAAGGELAGGLLVVPEAITAPDRRLTVAVGDHPEPGPGSLRAAGQLAEAVARVRPEDEVWVLLSGGTSSLIGAPLPGVAPEELRVLYHLLLGSGLDITAMNRIRKRFSRWAGGRLAAALYPAHVKNFTISDVIGDDLASIGSGPCVPDTSTAAEVRAALTTAGLWEKTPGPLRRQLEAVERGEAPETPKPHDPALATTETVLIASNRLALEAAQARARSFGVKALLVDAALAGEAATVGQRLASQLLIYDGTRPSDAQGGFSAPVLLIWGGETTVTLDSAAGRGGRSQELALAAARTLVRRRDDGRPIYLLAAGTDGRDGPTDAAGALVDAGTWDAARKAGRDPERDLASHQSYEALAAAGALFKTGLTGTNVMDLVLGLIG